MLNYSLTLSVCSIHYFYSFLLYDCVFLNRVIESSAFIENASFLFVMSLSHVFAKLKEYYSKINISKNPNHTGIFCLSDK